MYLVLCKPKIHYCSNNYPQLVRIVTWLYPSVQINNQLDAAISPVSLLDIYLQLNVFRAFSGASSGAQQMQWQPLALPSERGDWSAVGRCRAGWPDNDQQHCYHHAPKVKPEAATAFVYIHIKIVFIYIHIKFVYIYIKIMFIIYVYILYIFI